MPPRHALTYWKDMTPLSEPMETLLKRLLGGWAVDFKPNVGLCIVSAKNRRVRVSTSTMMGLRARGLVEREGKPGEFKYVVTPKGKEVADGLG